MVHMVRLQVVILILLNDFKLNETLMRRVRNYEYRNNSECVFDGHRIVVSTELEISGVFNILKIYPDGKTEVKIEISHR